MRELGLELLEFIDDVLDDLGSRREVEYIRKILTDGTSAERQLQVYRETGDLRSVVQSIVEETRESVEQSARTYHI
jgi:carboxylate-amine ligase